MPRKPPEDGILFTSVELDRDLFRRAWSHSPNKTKKAFFEELLQIYLHLHEQGQVKKLRGKLVEKHEEIADLRE